MRNNMSLAPKTGVKQLLGKQTSTIYYLRVDHKAQPCTPTSR